MAPGFSFGDTPPSTVIMKDAIQKQKSAIADAQAQLDLDAFAGPMETPIMGGAAARRAGGVAFAGVPETPDAGAAQSAAELATDILLYRNPPLTYVVGGLGAVLLAAAVFAAHGAHGLTLLTVLSYALLADLALNFFRSLVSKSWQESGGWAASGAAEAAAERAAAAVRGLAAAHDRFLLCREPTMALKVAAGLWALSVLGSYLSVWALLALAYVAAFTLPAAYDRNRTALHRSYTSLSSAASQRWDALGLSRKQKALVLALVLGSLWLRSAWATRAVALLLGALAVRCHLKPAEVERIMAAAEPYTMSVKKRMNRMSVAATDFALRSVGGKTHRG